MKIVIVGAGPAGVSVVETLRNYDRQSQLVMLSAEPYPPYSPPAMADHFISGSDAHLWRGEDWPERMDVAYQPGVRSRRSSRRPIAWRWRTGRSWNTTAW